MVRLSVITVCFNEKNIERTCESIVKQTNQDFEWIVIDGGSTDGTLDILEKYKDRINVFVSEPDNGIYNAMNKGIKRSSGEYLNFMNGGDEFASIDVIDKFLNLGNEYDNTDVIYGDVIFYQTKKINKIRFPEKIDDMYFIGNCINHQSAFIKRELFDKFGLYNENLRIVADAEKWVIFAKNNCTFKHCDFFVANFYAGGVSSTDKVNRELALMRSYHYSSFERKVFDLSHKHKIIKINLFNFIPFIKIKRIKDVMLVLLFNLIPLYKIKFNEGMERHFLFGFIPLFKVSFK